MKKAKRTSPRRLQVCLNLLPSDLTQNSSAHKFNKPLQPKTSSNKQKPRYSTNGKTIQTQPCQQRGIIRLGSKKKLLQREAKQNIQPPRQISQIVNKKQSRVKNSLSKYFQSNRSVKYLELNKNNVSSFDSEASKLQHRYKTQIRSQEVDHKFDGISLKSNHSRNSSNNKMRNSLLSMSRNKSIKTFQERKEQKRDRSCSLNKQFGHPQPQRKLNSRLQKLKQYKFIQEYLSDWQLEGMFNQLELANIPEIRWSLIIVDKVYQIMRKRQSNDFTGEVIRRL